MKSPDEDQRLLYPDEIPEFPVVDAIELSNRCPATCIMCPKGLGLIRRPQGTMDVKIYASLLRQLHSTTQNKLLTLHNLGESTLHPQLADCVSMAHKLGFGTEVSINPGLLPLSYYRELEQAGLTRLVLPLDAIDAATLTRIRGKGVKPELAVAHLDAVLQYRRQHPRQQPHILVQMIRMRSNEAQWADFLRHYAKNTIEGVDAFIKEIDANTHASAHNQFCGRVYPYLCRAPWRSVVVLWDGRVVPCCYDADAAYVLGDLQQNTLEEIWQSPAAHKLRQQHREHNFADGHLCAACAHRPDRYHTPDLNDIPTEPLHW